ncbi:hypothetical protein CBL_06894 [Carabus blaptoides fortunei]
MPIILYDDIILIDNKEYMPVLMPDQMPSPWQSKTADKPFTSAVQDVEDDSINNIEPESDAINEYTHVVRCFGVTRLSIHFRVSTSRLVDAMGCFARYSPTLHGHPSGPDQYFSH